MASRKPLVVVSGVVQEVPAADYLARERFAITVQALSSAPVDAVNNFFGTSPKAPSVNAAENKIFVRQACKIIAAEIYCWSTVAGSNNAWGIHIRVNNTTDTLIATVTAATAERVFTNSALSIALAAGDYFEIKSINPTWTTNPTGMTFGGYVVLELT